MTATTDTLPELDERKATILGFMAGGVNSATDPWQTPEQWIIDHLRAMGLPPRARFRDEMRALKAYGWVEKREQGWVLTPMGRAYCALRFGYGWLVTSPT